MTSKIFSNLVGFKEFCHGLEKLFKGMGGVGRGVCQSEWQGVPLPHWLPLGGSPGAVENHEELREDRDRRDVGASAVPDALL